MSKLTKKQKILQEEVIEGEDLKTLLSESKMPA